MMKSISTGSGLALLAAVWAIQPLMPTAGGRAALASASPIQRASSQTGTATVVGYWVNPDTARCTQGDDTNGGFAQTHVRLWSNGRVEMRRVVWDNANLWVPNHWECREELEFAPEVRSSQWFEVPHSTDGMACAPDLNGDRFVDGADLGSLLAAWGPTPPCPPFPEIACPLTMSSHMHVGGGVN